MRVLLIHGIHAPEGSSNIAMLMPYLKGAMPKAVVEVFSYGFMGFWQARWKNNSVAERLAKEQSSEDEVWITHSNGAAIAYLAVKNHGASPSMIININPALDRDLAASVPVVEVIHSKEDRAVYFSRWLPFHVWGDQGKVGYKGERQDVVNHNASEFGGSMRYDDHCGLFSSVRIREWATFIAHLIGKSQGQKKDN